MIEFIAALLGCCLVVLIFIAVSLDEACQRLEAILKQIQDQP